jgi:hypothetical protein
MKLRKGKDEKNGKDRKRNGKGEGKKRKNVITHGMTTMTIE